MHPRMYPHRQTTLTKCLVSICLLAILSLSAFDRSSIEGIVPLIQEHFNIHDAETASIQTSSTITNVVALGFVWIFGDSVQRRKLFLSSVSLWIAFALFSVVLGSNSFMILVVFRAFGAASVATFKVLIQVILADLFRDRALGIAMTFMAACDIISGMITGIISSWIVSSGMPWQTGLLAGPLLSIPPLICLFFTSRSFYAEKQLANRNRIVASAFGILSIKSYLLWVSAVSLGMFHVKAYNFWSPSMFLSALESFSEAFSGLSYTTIISLNSFAMMIGMIFGVPPIMWLAQCWHHGTGCLAGKAGCTRAYPIVVVIGSFLQAGSFIVAISLIACLFLDGVGSATQVCLNQQMLLLSDALHGDSSLPVDRFRAYQLAQLCASSFAVASAISSVIMVFTYPEDVKRAEDMDNKTQKEVDEETSLIGDSKLRSESIFESIARSRATTAASYF